MTKQCTKCHKVKEVTLYFKDNQKKDKLGSWCKECVSESVRKTQDRQGVKYLDRLRKKPRYPSTQKVMEWQHNNKHKVRAYRILQQSIKKGTTIKADKCVVCNSDRFIKALYLDYEKPLNVIWLCSKCMNQYRLGVSKRSGKIKQRLEAI